MGVIPGEEQSVFGGGPKVQNRYDDAWRHNPGTRITLSREPGLTAPGVLTDPFVFPAPPLDQLQRSLAFNWQDYDTVSAGQFSRRGGMTLQTISFDTIIVCDDYPWIFYNPLRRFEQSIDDVDGQLEDILRAGTPFNFAIEDVQFKPDSSGTATGVLFDFGPSPVVRMLATLRTYVSTKKSGEPDAIYVTCGFTEHRKAGATQRKLGVGGTGTGSSGKGGDNSRSLPTTVDLLSLSGTSLQDLAVTYYGSASKWTYIKSSNPWLGNVTATQDLSDHSTAALKTAAKEKKKIAIPVIAGGGRA